MSGKIVVQDDGDRKIYTVDVGNLPKEVIDKWLDQIMESKKKPKKEENK